MGVCAWVCVECYNIRVASAELRAQTTSGDRLNMALTGMLCLTSVSDFNIDTNTSARWILNHDALVQQRQA